MYILRGEREVDTVTQKQWSQGVFDQREAVLGGALYVLSHL